MDFCYEKEGRLKELRRENEMQWKKLQKMQQSSPLSSMTTTTNTSTGSAGQALWVELRAVTSKTTDAPLIAALHDDDGDTKSYCRQQIIQSYDELRQVNVVLDQRIRIAQERLVSLQNLNNHHRQVQERIQTLMALNHDNNCNHAIRKGLSLSQVFINGTTSNENEWVRNELSHVAQQLVLEDDQPSVAARVEQHQRKKQRGMWTLDRLVQELVQRASNKSDPYLLTTHLPIQSEHITFLRSCHVIQCHENDEQLICLTNYT